MNTAERKAAVCRFLDQHAARFREISAHLFRHPEVAFQEVEAAKVLTAELGANQFQVERGVAGLPTAWRATYGQAGPAIAFLSEYDALPEIGHACGHHLIGAAGVAAAVALRRSWPDVPGRIVHLGTPAEEDGGGKVIMVEQGLFDDLAAAMMFHPSPEQTLAHRHALACQDLIFRFRGRSAHAAAAPWNGVNALDAVVQFFVGVGLLRQQLKPTARVHGIISHGGSAANVIPEFTEAKFMVRATEYSYLAEVKARVLSVADGAAKSVGCSLEVEEGVSYANRRNNMVMAGLFRANAEALGEMVSEPDPAASVGSSDIGNVSLVCPTIHPYVQVGAKGLVGHTPAYRDACATEYAYAQMIKAAKAMAMTAVDLLACPETLAAAREEFAAPLLTR